MGFGVDGGGVGEKIDAGVGVGQVYLFGVEGFFFALGDEDPDEGAFAIDGAFVDVFEGEVEGDFAALGDIAEGFDADAEAVDFLAPGLGGGGGGLGGRQGGGEQEGEEGGGVR